MGLLKAPYSHLVKRDFVRLSREKLFLDSCSRNTGLRLVLQVHTRHKKALSPERRTKRFLFFNFINQFFYLKMAWYFLRPFTIGERVPEETDAGGRGVERRRERGREENARRSRQARRGDIPARGHGQERLHLSRGVQRPEARRVVS